MAASRHEDEIDREIDDVAALADPVRRRLYRYVADSADAVSREQAAADVGVAHHVAKFHLDRLEADGLLDTEFRRPAGRSGPGAGRPAKFYRRSGRQLAVSLPERRYDLAAQVLAAAIGISERDRVAISDAVGRAARAAGHRIGADARDRDTDSPTAAARLCAALEERGYEPQLTDDGITLRNCPFHVLAAEYTSLVCGMNLDLVDGAIAELGDRRLHARLEPAPDRCCVTVAGSGPAG
jgi:predicted ArsR family transcriptional regulator